MKHRKNLTLGLSVIYAFIVAFSAAVLLTGALLFLQQGAVEFAIICLGMASLPVAIMVMIWKTLRTLRRR